MKPSEKKYLIDLVNTGLAGEISKFELAAMTFARSIKKDDPELANGINDAITSFSLSGSYTRSTGMSPLPVDRDSQLDMVTICTPDLSVYISPILPPYIEDRVSGFLEERSKMQVLLERGLKPSTSLLLVGPPGTGKTMLAKHIASTLNKNLVILDLSTSMSSYMGKTGANLKRVLQYAKQNASVLLFDEFDAIAKKRDDNSDLGEIKRIVNVLLMELEDWPASSVFIATSNHPELLDRAIWRRFDHHLTMALPSPKERIEVLQKELTEFLNGHGTDNSILTAISELFEDKSQADICKYANNVKRRSVLRSENPVISLFHELEEFKEDKKMRAKFCTIAKDALGDKITVRELAEITGLSPAGVQHHLNKSKTNE